MTYTPTKTLTFDEFIAQYGDDPRYELIDGELRDTQQQYRLGQPIHSPWLPHRQLRLDDILPR